MKLILAKAYKTYKILGKQLNSIEHHGECVCGEILPVLDMVGKKKLKKKKKKTQLLQNKTFFIVKLF
jgi:hypothetical protein